MNVIDSDTGQEFRLYSSEALEADLKLHYQSECKHAATELRQRTLANGAIQRREQCTRCGTRIGNAQKPPPNGIELPLDDDALVERWTTARKRDYDSVIQRHVRLQKRERTTYRSNYNSYLKSEKWAARRAKVMARAQGVCEGCGDSEATEVHHLHYDNVGNEFLFELVALCRPCHERVHHKEDTELPCVGCRNQSHRDGMLHCGVFDQASYLALSFFGECGPDREAFEPLK